MGISLLWNEWVIVAQSCLTLCDPMHLACQAPLSVDFPGKNTGVGCHFLLQGIFLTQGSNNSLLHCKQILYPVTHQGSLVSLTSVWGFCLFVYFPTLGLWLQAPSERSPGEGNSNPLQYSYLGNPKDREAWWATVQRVAKSGTRLSRPGLKDCLRHRKARHQLLYGRKWKIFFHVHFTCSPWPVWEAGSPILDLFCNGDLPALVEMLSICSGADGLLPWWLRM